MDDIFACTKLLDSPYFKNCEKIENFEMSREGCWIKSLTFTEEEDIINNFHLNLETEERFYPHLKKKTIDTASELSLKDIITKWKLSFLRDSFWFGDMSDEPFEEGERKIRINIPELEGRRSFDGARVKISSLSKLYYHRMCFIQVISPLFCCSQYVNDNFLFCSNYC